MDCSHRFISIVPARPENHIPVSALIVLLALVLAAGTAILLQPSPSPAQHQPTASMAISPEDLKAAQGGDASAQFRVGEALLQTSIREKGNTIQAVRWLQSAAENGNTMAMLQLGKLYRSGVGVLQNFDLSAKWIQTAAARGDAAGMLELGRLYRDGIGFRKNAKHAYVWFNRSAAMHNQDAVREREEVARTLTLEELKEAQNLSSVVDAATEASSKKSDSVL